MTFSTSKMLVIEKCGTSKAVNFFLRGSTTMIIEEARRLCTMPSA